MQSTTKTFVPDPSQSLSLEAAQHFLNALPEKIKLGLLTYTAQLDQPVENVLEMAIAGFLDEDAVSFAKCQPLSGMNFPR